MRKRSKIVPVFLLFLFLSLFSLFLLQLPIFRNVTGFFEKVFQPVQGATISFYSFFLPNNTTELQQLRSENQKLQHMLVDQKEILKENAALQDQFKQSSADTSHLMPAKIIGLSSFVPGVTQVDEVIVDKGSKDGIAKNMVVITKDTIFGKVTDVSPHLAKVSLVTSKGTTVTAKTTNTEALGIINGKGNTTLSFENVILSDKLEIGDIVVTKGDIDSKGFGYPPGLIVGKIISVDKNPSALFQSGEVNFAIDAAKLTTVFIIVP